jgi:predicted amidophosphoribosyltransferase
MAVLVIAICSNPDCTRHASAAAAAQLPRECPTCGSAMVDQCWKCDRPLADPFSAYCAACGVPLKRILPEVEAREPLLAICSNPECDGWVATMVLAALPSRCSRCHAPLVSHCWKCGTRVVEADQQYCQFCGVPLKRRSQSAYNWKSTRAVTPTP